MDSSLTPVGVTPECKRIQLMPNAVSCRRTVYSFGVAATFAMLAVMPAQAASGRVERACAGDVRRLCPKDKKDSPSLRYCMEAKGRSLSRNCIRALEDSGDIPRGYFDK